MNDKYLIAIMAAGESRRLGQPKQLLNLNGQSLVNRTITECLKVESSDTIVVLGANSGPIENQLVSRNEIRVLLNRNWTKGLSESIRKATKEAMVDAYQGIIIVLCDQIYLKATILEKLIIRHRKSGKIVSCMYNEGNGPPTLFDSCLFADLICNQNLEGAKDIFIKYPQDIEYVDFALGCQDIDTPEDLIRLRNFIS